MKIWICDDAPGFLEEYKKLVLQQAEELCLHAEVRTFASGEEILSYAQAGHQADVIFLDILMGELNGIDTAMALREMGVETHIVFITSTPDYAIEGYKAKAFRYILKPIRIDTVRTLLEEILEEGREDSLVVPLENPACLFKRRISYISSGSTARRLSIPRTTRWNPRSAWTSWKSSWIPGSSAATRASS